MGVKKLQTLGQEEAKQSNILFSTDAWLGWVSSIFGKLVCMLTPY